MDEGEKYDYFDLASSPSLRKRSFPFSPPASNASGIDPSETDDTDSNHGGPGQSGASGQCWKHARQNHSQIEKRRRDKMNMYINELASLVPMCSAMAKKLDKLTVLRMVVQYVKTVRGAVHSYTEGTYKPSFVTDAELRSLLLRITDGFVFVVGCDRGRLLFVSESVTSVLGYPRAELLGQSWFDILHPKDVQKIKEQLAASDLSPRERYIDSKTMLPVKTGLGTGHGSQTTGGLCPGARRAFFCRMRAKDADSKQSRHQKRFNVIRCVGYLKAWTPMDDEEGGGGNLSCLVAVGRVMPPSSHYSLPPPLRPDVPTTNISGFHHPHQHGLQTGLSFCSRHSLDGKYVYVDPGVTYILGYLPQEVIGLNLSDFYHPDDSPSLADIHRRALTEGNGILSPTYRFRAKDGSHPVLQTHFKAFRNPWTKDIEFIVARNFIPLRSGTASMIKTDETGDEQSCAMVDAGSVGIRPILAPSTLTLACPAQGASAASSTVLPPCSSESLPPSSCLLPANPTVAPSTNVVVACSSVPAVDPNVRNSNPSGLSVAPAAPTTVPSDALLMPSAPLAGDLLSDCGGCSSSVVSDGGGAGSTASAGTATTTATVAGIDPLAAVTASDSDGNDEAAMAVIMRLLEVDAGLGGPVDYSGLPWPLT